MSNTNKVVVMVRICSRGERCRSQFIKNSYDCVCNQVYELNFIKQNYNHIYYDHNGYIYDELPGGKCQNIYYKTTKKISLEPNQIPISKNLNISVLSPPIPIPQDNINLCFVGGVSTGKSTILNAIFSEQLTQCKIKRTTMVPTIYIENPDHINPFDKVENTERIYAQIEQKNKEIIEQTEQGNKLSLDAYNELIFNVGKLDIHILDDSFVNVYDIPGLNDARTKDIYYKYLDSNFHRFNLMILLVDIHSGLNTSDEMDMLRFVTSRVKYNKELESGNRKIYTLVVVNKADDMQWNDETGQLELTGELSEMYAQTENTVNAEFAAKGVQDQLIGILPLCAADAYLYRMVKKHGPYAIANLTPEQILKIGINDMGKKFSTKKPAEQKKEVQTILENKAFVDDMIKLSGFQTFVNMISNFLNTNGQNKKIRIHNILYEIEKLPNFADFDLFGNLFLKTLQKKCELLKKIAKIDETEYHELMRSMMTEIKTLFEMRICDFLKNLEELIYHYKTFKAEILDVYFAEYDNPAEYNECGYSKYVIELIIGELQNELEYAKTVEKYIALFKMLSDIGAFQPAIVEKFLKQIITNQYTILFEYTNGGTDDLISFLTQMKSINLPLIPFVRYLLICRYENLDDRESCVKYMSYKHRGEIPICTMLMPTKSNYVQQWVEWVPDQGLDELDLFYLGL